MDPEEVRTPFTDDSHGRDYTIHVDVEGTQLPPHPGPGWTRFVCISDTHSRKYRVPSGDVLLHAGDLSSWGHPPQLATTIEWLKSLDHPVKMSVLSIACSSIFRSRLVASLLGTMMYVWSQWVDTDSERCSQLCLDQQWVQWGIMGSEACIVQPSAERVSDDVTTGCRTSACICAQPIIFQAPLSRTRTLAVYGAIGETMEGLWVTSTLLLSGAMVSIDELSFKAAPLYVQGAFQYESVDEAQGVPVRTQPSCLMVTPSRNIQ